MNNDILGINDINRGNVAEVHPEIVDASRIDRENDVNPSTIDVVDLSGIGINTGIPSGVVNESVMPSVPSPSEAVKDEVVIPNTTSPDVVIPSFDAPVEEVVIPSGEVNLPSSKVIETPEPKKEDIVLDPNNLIGVPMTRQEIYEEKALEAEKNKESETRNESGYFGGPIKARIPGDDYTEEYSDEENKSEEEAKKSIEEEFGINKLGEEVPSDLSKQYEGFNSHGVRI